MFNIFIYANVNFTYYLSKVINTTDKTACNALLIPRLM